MKFQPIATAGWRLMHERSGQSATPAKEGDAVTTFRGEPATVICGTPPHKPGSTGRILVRIDGSEAEFFPGVVNCVWVRTALSRPTRNAVAKYGEANCREAYRLNVERGEGANTIAGALLRGDFDTRKGDALVNAGRELVTGSR